MVETASSLKEGKRIGGQKNIEFLDREASALVTRNVSEEAAGTRFAYSRLPRNVTTYVRAWKPELASPNQPQRDSVRFSGGVAPGKPQAIAKRLISYE